MQIPWKLSRKNPIDELLDVFVEAPGVLSKVGQLERTPPDLTITRMLEIINQCWSMDLGLHVLYQEFCQARGGKRVYWRQPCELCSAADDLGPAPFSESIFFEDIECCRVMLLYWAVRAMLWSGMCLLYDLLPKYEALDRGGPFATQLPSLGHRTHWVHLIWNICQSVEYCVQSNVHSYGAYCIAAPLNIAIDVLKPFPMYQKEMNWAEVSRLRVSQAGMSMLQYMPK